VKPFSFNKIFWLNNPSCNCIEKELALLANNVTLGIVLDKGFQIHIHFMRIQIQGFENECRSGSGYRSGFKA